MDGPLLVAVGTSIANLVLLVVLLAIWGRNYLLFRNQELLALCCFAVVFATENVASIGFHFGMGMRTLYADSATAVLVAVGLQTLQFVALCFLAWATLR